MAVDTPALTRREQILAELMRRLRCITDPRTSKHILVEFGYDGIDVNQVPKIVIFEDSETVIEVKRGIYEKTLPMQIEYFKNCSKPADIPVTGNRMLAEVTAAIEIDERFFIDGQPAEQATPSVQGQGLVRSYQQTRNDIIEVANPHRALLIVWYSFVYWTCRPGVIAARR